MSSDNGVIDTVEHDVASTHNGNVPPVGTSQPPPDVLAQSISIHTQDWYFYALAAVVGASMPRSGHVACRAPPAIVQ
jgi:hypothetical protein